MIMIADACLLPCKSSTVLRTSKMATSTQTVENTTHLPMAISNITSATSTVCLCKMDLRCLACMKMLISAINSKSRIKQLRLCSQFNRELHQAVLDLHQIKLYSQSAKLSSMTCQNCQIVTQERKNSSSRLMAFTHLSPLYLFKKWKSSTECLLS